MQKNGIEWLGEIVLGTGFDAAHYAVDLVERGNYDNRNVAGLLGRLQSAQYFVATHFRHDEIEQNKIEILSPNEVERGGAVGGGHDAVAFPRQPAGQHVAIGGIVVDDQYSARSNHLLQRVADGQWLDSAQHLGDNLELLDATAAIAAGLLRSRQCGHGVDLTEQLIGGLLQLH